MKQTDLDKAIALLDQSPHLTSLRLTLSPKTITNVNLNKQANDFHSIGHAPHNNNIIRSNGYHNDMPLNERMHQKSSTDEPEYNQVQTVSFASILLLECVYNSIQIPKYFN